jgi:hypothetical protein
MDDYNHPSCVWGLSFLSTSATKSTMCLRQAIWRNKDAERVMKNRDKFSN